MNSSQRRWLARAVFASASALLAPSAAHAALTVELSGVAGAGETTIVFSGSSVVTAGSGTFVVGNSDIGSWFSFGDYINSIDNQFFAITSGSATVSVNGGGVRNLDAIYLDQDADGLDDFGFSVAGSDLSFVQGDTLSWNGSLAIGVDFSEFQLGSFSTDDFGFGLADAQVNMTIDAAAIPEPASLALLGLGLAGLGFSRRKQ